MAATAPAAEVPEGFAAYNENLDSWNTFYWSPQAWASAPGDVSAAVVTHWLVRPDAGDGHAWSRTIPHSIKRPLDGRVWFRYPDQAPTNARVAGTGETPSVVARVLDDGTTQRRETDLNSRGQVTRRTDPLGRTTTYAYAANGRDLLEVRQTTPGGSDVLARYADDTPTGQPQTITDAAGQTTTLTYTAAGEVQTVTNARGETTTYGYDGSGRLTSVTGPVAGATTTSTYDGYGRVRTMTTDGATVTTEYDVFDRPTVVWYPDGTTERWTYARLDVATWTDRLGRTTRYVYDAGRRRVATRDAAGRTIRQTYGPTSDQLIDANGHATTWERDLQGRVTREVRADGLTATVYTYEPRSGRLPFDVAQGTPSGVEGWRR